MMKTKNPWGILLFGLCIPLFGQVKMGDRPEQLEPYAILEMESTRKGILIPRMTTGQRDLAFTTQIPDALMIYNRDTECLEIFMASQKKWKCIGNPKIALGLKGNILNVDAQSIDLNSFMDNTDKQYLRLEGTVLTLDNGGQVDLKPLINATGDSQKLSLNTTILSLERGGSVDLKNINTDGQQFSVSLTDSTTALIQITGGNSITLKAGNNIILSQPHSTTLFIHSETAGFTNQNGVTSNARGDLKNDDFVFGSNQLDNDKSTTADNKRIFFDKSKGAFRAGFAQSDQWDEKKLGTYSIALGRNTIASGFHAAAFGSGTLSGAWYTTAMGQGTQALSRSETAIGQFNTTYSPAGSTDNWVPIDRLYVIGNGTVSGTVVSRSDALVMLKNGNTEVSGT